MQVTFTLGDRNFSPLIKSIIVSRVQSTVQSRVQSTGFVVSRCALRALSATFLSMNHEMKTARKHKTMGFKQFSNNPTLHIFNSGKICRVELCTELFHAMISTLFLYFWLICYPYISLHFQCFLFLLFSVSLSYSSRLQLYFRVGMQSWTNRKRTCIPGTRYTSATGSSHDLMPTIVIEPDLACKPRNFSSTSKSSSWCEEQRTMEAPPWPWALRLDRSGCTMRLW